MSANLSNPAIPEIRCYFENRSWHGLRRKRGPFCNAGNRPIADIRSTRHHRQVSPTAYFLPTAAHDADLSAWASIIPPGCRVLRSNLFGDMFLLAPDGVIYMFDRGGFSVERIAPSEEVFWREVHDDPEGWQFRPLADECSRAGKVLMAEQCYAFTRPPVLGGDYSVENVRVAPWQEWFSFTTDLFQQIKDLPDGAVISLKIED